MIEMSSTIESTESPAVVTAQWRARERQPHPEPAVNTGGIVLSSSPG